MEHRKTILRKIPSPLTIVTSSYHGQTTAAVVTFLTQTSIDPPLITMALRPGSDIYEFVKASGKATIHFPSKEQQAMTAQFFKIKEATENSLNGNEFSLSNDGFVHLKDIPMILDCEVREIVEQGDHHLAVCEVINTSLVNDYDTLLLSDTNWKYGG